MWEEFSELMFRLYQSVRETSAMGVTETGGERERKRTRGNSRDISKVRDKIKREK